MLGQAKQAMIRSLAPEIRSLIDTDMHEEDNQNLWTIAIGRIEYANLCQAHARHPDTTIMYALTGVPDDVFPVRWEDWKEYVFKTDLFTQGGKWNGSSYTKEQLESILDRTISSDDITYDD